MIWRRNRIPDRDRARLALRRTQPAVVVGKPRRLGATLRAAAARLPARRSAARSRKRQGQRLGGRRRAADASTIQLTVLMLQLKSFSRTIIVVLTAPLGLIGVAAFLLAFGKPFGFVALLGTIALSGMIMRNSVILVDPIRQDVGTGHAVGEPSSSPRCGLPPDHAHRRGDIHNHGALVAQAPSSGRWRWRSWAG